MRLDASVAGSSRNRAGAKMIRTRPGSKRPKRGADRHPCAPFPTRSATAAGIAPTGLPRRAAHEGVETLADLTPRAG